MPNNFGPSRFGVKFWLASAAVLSTLVIADATIITVQAKSRHVDFWILGGINRFLAVALTWSTWFGGRRQIRGSAVRSGASQELLLSIDYWSSMTLSMVCVALAMVLWAALR